MDYTIIDETGFSQVASWQERKEMKEEEESHRDSSQGLSDMLNMVQSIMR